MLLLLFMNFSIITWNPRVDQEPRIKIELREAQQKVDDAMSILDNLDIKLKIVNQKIIQVPPGTDTDKLKTEQNQLQEQIKEAKEKARIAKNELNEVHQKQEDYQTGLSQR